MCLTTLSSFALLVNPMQSKLQVTAQKIKLTDLDYLFRIEDYMIEGTLIAGKDLNLYKKPLR